MNTDTPFYRLFQERPATVFELAGLPVPENPAYRLHAEEVKQTAFRLDGVLQPETGRDDLPLIFVETHGNEVCPANWRPGQKTVKTTCDGIADYLKEKK